MLAATEGDSERQRKKSEQQDHIQHFFHKTCNSEVSGSFTLSSCKTTAKDCPKKKVFCTCKVVFLLIRPTVFLAVFVAVAAQHYTSLYFVSVNYRY